jgi:DNA-binding NarL/FixJ family response regulator
MSENLVGNNACGEVPASQVTTIVIVDDNAMFASLLSAALNTAPDLQCVGTASSSAEGIRVTAALKPDIVIMDIQMSGQDGLVATSQIRKAAPDTVVVVVSAHHDSAWVARAAQAGAAAFVAKNGRLDEMTDVLRRVRSGENLLDPPRAAAPSLAACPKLEPVPALDAQPRGATRVLGNSRHTGRGLTRALRSKLHAAIS